MNLEQLIELLERQNPTTVLRRGFHNPHSYRGYYEHLAFEITDDICIGNMLRYAKEALGNTYEGWKGGDYIMNGYTDVYLSNVGETGEELGEMLLQCMLNNKIEFNDQMTVWKDNNIEVMQ